MLTYSPIAKSPVFATVVQARPNSFLPVLEAVRHHGPNLDIRICSSLRAFAGFVVPIHYLQWIARCLHLCHVRYET